MFNIICIVSYTYKQIAKSYQKILKYIFQILSETNKKK